MRRAPERKNYHHGDLRAQILLKSAEIIATEGIEALSIRQVAKSLGVSHNAPSRHFENRAALIQELVLDILGGQRQLLIGVLELNESQPERTRLREALRAYLGWCDVHPIEAQVMHHPDVRKMADLRIQEAMRDWAHTVESLLGHRRDKKGAISSQALHFFSLTLGGGAILLNPLLRGVTAEADGSQLIDRLVEEAYP